MLALMITSKGVAAVAGIPYWVDQGGAYGSTYMADPAERIIFWHRGFAISDIVLGAWIHAQAEAKGVGTMLTLWDGPDE